MGNSMTGGLLPSGRRELAATIAALWLLAGCPTDPTPSPDASIADAAQPDAGPLDADTEDAGERDAGERDAGERDAGERTCTEGSATDSAPVFAGAMSAEPDGRDAVILVWSPAVDDHTPPERMAYRVFVATTPGGQDFSRPRATVVGETTLRVPRLPEGVPSFFVVRATDELGQIECNRREVSATPAPITGCMDYETVIQGIFDEHCVRCHGDVTAERELRLDSYAGVVLGGASGQPVVPCQPEQSLLYLKVARDRPPQGERMPRDGPYLNSADIERVGLWIAQGSTAACPEDTLRCGDVGAPTFGGITTAVLTSETTAELCWASGGDDVTSSAELIYDLYVATAPGAEDFALLPRAVSAPGATCVTASGLVPGQEYCFVARARDRAGNHDANTAERCLTPPSVACVEYATHIQPLFDRECVHCHGGRTPIRDLSLESYAGVLRGGRIIACYPAPSLLYMKIGPTPPGVRMPLDGPPYLTPVEIELVGQWIEQGARMSCSDPDPC